MKMEHLIWEGLLDHARTAWYRTNWMIEKYSRKTIASLAAFDKVWMQSAYIGYRQGSDVTWNYSKSPRGRSVGNFCFLVCFLAVRPVLRLCLWFCATFVSVE
jgi:hypothetical protein